MNNRVLFLLLSTVAPLFAATAADAPFVKGSRLWSVSTGYSRDSEHGALYLVQIHRNDYLADQVSLYYGLNLGYADPRNRPAGLQGGPEIGTRWHFADWGTWSVFLNGSVGAVGHEYAWTEESLRFNFDLQGSVGATRRINPDLILKTEFGWHHLSNARVRGKKRNLGYDGPMLSIGVMRSF